MDELEEKLDATPVEESPPMDDDLRGRLMRTFREKGFSERPQRHAFATFVLGRPIRQLGRAHQRRGIEDDRRPEETAG